LAARITVFTAAMMTHSRPSRVRTALLDARPAFTCISIGTAAQAGMVSGTICNPNGPSRALGKLLFQFVRSVVYTEELLLSGGTEQLEGGGSLVDARWFET
jgi:hypothetical protein